MQVEQAQDTLKLIKELARQAPPTAEGFTIRQQARAAEESYRKALRRVDPDLNLLNQYDEAVTNYSKGLGVLDILKNSGAIVGDESGITLNNAALSKFLLENADRFPATKYPEIWKVANRGGPLGATDVAKNVTPRVYVPGTTIGVSGPTIKTYRRAGQQVPGVVLPQMLQLPADLMGIRAASSILGGQGNEQ
jgi:hypothetical protein